MPFNPKPTLTFDKYKIRPLESDDYDALFFVSSETGLWDMHPSSKSELTHRGKPDGFAKWFESAIAGDALVLIDESVQKLIGTTRFYEADAEKSEIVLGYTFLSTHYWGSGANFAMKQALFSHAKPHFDTLWLHIDPNNIRSAKAAQKVGAVFDHEGWHDFQDRKVYYAYYNVDLKNHT